MNAPMFTITSGDLAYLDTFAGLVPCKVLKVEEVERPITGKRVECTVRVTATRRGYPRGEVIPGEEPGFNVVSRRQIVVRSHQYRIVGQTIAVPDTPHHDAFSTPIDGGPRHRSECSTCGTVLRLHDTEAEADAWAAAHITDPEGVKHAAL